MQYLPNPEEQRWLVRYMRRLIENMGHEQFVLAPILEPSRKWFPEDWSGAIYDAHLITQRLLDYAGLKDLRAVIEGFIERDDLDTESGDASGYFSGIRDGVAYFGLKQATLTDPEIAAGTMAHEVAHAWRAFHRERLEHADQQEEVLTDITTVYLGFGVLTTNDTHRFRSEGTIREQRWSSSSYGYLPLQAMSYLLGLQLAARNRDEEISSIEKQLEPNQRRAVLETLESLEESDVLDLLALPPRESWGEPETEPRRIRLIEPDATTAIEIERPQENPQRNREQYVYRAERDTPRSMRPWKAAVPVFGALIGIIVLMRGVQGDMRAIVIVFVVAMIASLFMSQKSKTFVCSDKDCTHPLTMQDTVCPGCAGTIAANAEDALERNAASAEFVECEDCEPEMPCDRHAS
ncbi:MAG TPA: hypothetical protein VF608_10510 [Thermoanaerobaculia bacterium]